MTRRGVAAAVGLAALVAGGAPARAQAWELERAPEEPSVELEAGAFATEGNEQRVRELLRRPVDAWLALRAFVPVDHRFGVGRVDLELTTAGTGRLRLGGRLSDRSVITLHMRRDRLPYAARARSTDAPLAEDAAVLGDLELVHEQVTAGWTKPLAALGAGGALELTLEFDRRTGELAALPAGLTATSPLEYRFGYAAYREVDDFATALGAAVSGSAAGTRFRVEAAVRRDETTERLVARDRAGAAGAAAGLLDHRRDEFRTAVEAGVSAESLRPRALAWGGSYRLRYRRSDPRERRELVATAGADGTVTTGDVDVSELRHRAAVGAVWTPGRDWRLAARLDGAAGDLDADADEERALATVQVVRGDSAFSWWRHAARLEATWTGLSWVTLDARAVASYQRGDDDWDQVYLLADRTTVAGERALEQERERTRARVELEGTTAVVPRTRLSAGVRAELDQRDVTVDRAVDETALGELDGERVAAWLSFRTRVGRRLRADGRLTWFSDEREMRGAESEHTGLDARVRATGSAGPGTAFLALAVSDDRWELSPESAAGRPAGFEAIEFDGRSWIVFAGATAGFAGRGTASLVYAHVWNTEDLDSRLQDLSVSGGWRVARSVRLSATGRYLRFRDGEAPWDDGEAFLGMLVAAGTF